MFLNANMPTGFTPSGSRKIAFFTIVTSYWASTDEEKEDENHVKRIEKKWDKIDAPGGKVMNFYLKVRKDVRDPLLATLMKYKSSSL